jgi:hypothetical protein
MHFGFKDETSCRFGVLWLCAEKEENTGLDAGTCVSFFWCQSAEEFRVFAWEIAGALAEFGKGCAEGHDAAHGS